MKVKNLFMPACLPAHFVIEQLNGKFGIFNIVPFRKIKESDISPLLVFHPMTKDAAPAYMYTMYGLERGNAGKFL